MTPDQRAVPTKRPSCGYSGPHAPHTVEDQWNGRRSCPGFTTTPGGDDTTAAGDEAAALARVIAEFDTEDIREPAHRGIEMQAQWPTYVAEARAIIAAGWTRPAATPGRDELREQIAAALQGKMPSLVTPGWAADAVLPVVQAHLDLATTPTKGENVSPLPNDRPWFQGEGSLLLKTEAAQKFMALITGETGYLPSTKAIPIVDIRLTRVHYEPPEVNVGFEEMRLSFDFEVEEVEISLHDGKPAGERVAQNPEVDSDEAAHQVEGEGMFGKLRDGGNSCG